MRLYRLVAAIVAIGWGLGGCSGPFGWTRVTVNRPLATADIGFIVPGQTTWHEVTERLGAPNDLVGTRDGFLAAYSDYDSRSFRINFGWPLGFVAPFYAPHDLATGGQGIGVRTFAVAFDENGIARFADFVRGEAGSHYWVWPFDGSSP